MLSLEMVIKVSWEKKNEQLNANQSTSALLLMDKATGQEMLLLFTHLCPGWGSDHHFFSRQSNSTDFHLYT